MGQSTDYKVSDKVFTIPNLLSAIRLCMIPVFLVLLFNDFNLAATLVFAVAASTDWVDGQVARRTNSVSKLGQLLDPFVDRLLMISGVLGLFFVGRLPLWIIVVVVARDLIMLVGGSYLLSSMEGSRTRYLSWQVFHHLPLYRFCRNSAQCTLAQWPRYSRSPLVARALYRFILMGLLVYLFRADPVYRHYLLLHCKRR